MSRILTTTAPPPAGIARARRRRRLAQSGRLLVAFVVAVAAGILLVGLTSDSSPPPELNDMGMLVIDTPGRPHGSTTAGGVRVVGSSWDLGEVPLNVAVRPTWQLHNTGEEPVMLGQPRPEVREGCCPGPVTLEDPVLEPGETTTLTFELGMHAGMDGPHDLAVHVPVSGPDGTDDLVLDVVGDFGASGGVAASAEG